MWSASEGQLLSYVESAAISEYSPAPLGACALPNDARIIVIVKAETAKHESSISSNVVVKEHSTDDSASYLTNMWKSECWTQLGPLVDLFLYLCGKLASSQRGTSSNEIFELGSSHRVIPMRLHEVT